jgi:uncharacterized protein (TIGR02246 family)
MKNNFNEEQKRVFNTIKNAFENKDIDVALASYEADAIVMFEPQKPTVGKEAIRTALTKYFDMNAQFVSSGYEIYISGDIATSIEPWSMTGQLPDGTKIEQSGLGITVLRKQTDGNWLIVQDNPHGQFMLGK